MHDYDRRRLASSETSSKLDWDEISIERIVADVIRNYPGAMVAKIDAPRQTAGFVFEITGTTTDGRTFRSEVTFSFKGLTLHSEAKTQIEGMITARPVPDALLAMEASISKSLINLEWAALQMTVPRMRDHLHDKMQKFSKYHDHFILPAIEQWRRGEFVEPTSLRGYVSQSMKHFQECRDGLSLDLRNSKPPGETKRLGGLLEATHKAYKEALGALS